MDTLKKNILDALEHAPRYGFNVHSICMLLGRESRNAHLRVLDALHELLNEGRVRRTPNTCVWRLA